MIAVSQQLLPHGSVRRVEHKVKKAGGVQSCNCDRLHHRVECRWGVIVKRSGWNQKLSIRNT